MTSHKTTASSLLAWYFLLKCFGGVNAYNLSTYTLVGPFDDEFQCKAAVERIVSTSSQNDCPVVVLPCWSGNGKSDIH